ncbi:uncharacterized protein LOC106713417 isoform X1 [Papilio machaon]|uniref:uncharacterized protein LOC106713417 isoform X1 n=1 Tax=Papilio machaon TaxID=76193 RepID=UPI001E663176|nr:uncharacterized protein LOC106713417 isoform X1 [Papilio machaon]
MLIVIKWTVDFAQDARKHRTLFSDDWLVYCSIGSESYPSGTINNRNNRGDGGSCVGRNRCDYGTQYIDFTLYVPHGYIKQCLEDEVCCPPNFVTPEPERLFTPSDDYDFDDDD